YLSRYITPTHHALEFLTLAPLYLVMTRHFASRALSSPRTLQLLTSTDKRPPRSILEYILLAMLIFSLGMTVFHKVVTGTLLFLMQPCHATAGILILVMCWPNHKYPIIPRLLFNICLHTLWGTILALIWPDLRDHDIFGEVFNFFFEHLLILIIPLYMTLTGRYYVMPPTIDMALFSFFLYAAYHSPILHVFSLLSGFNLNYALVPPSCKVFDAHGLQNLRF
ncbi:transmembrane protein, partial [Dichotomocladium elegans]